MGHVLEALRQLENKQGARSSSGSVAPHPADAPAPLAACPPVPAESLPKLPAGEQPVAAGRDVPSVLQAAVSDDHLSLPPEYLPDSLALRQESELQVSAPEPFLTAAADARTALAACPPVLPELLPRTQAGEQSLAAGGQRAELSGPYDKLAETILAQIARGRPAALCFTSIEESIGRTAMVASLAAALARRQPQGVLAVDADFRQARGDHLASRFGVLPGLGLAGVLGGRVAWDEAIAATGIPSLFVLPAGRTDSGEEKGDSPHLCEAPGGRAPTEGWFRQMGTVPFFPPENPPPDQLAPLLEQWYGRFPLVLVDAPSLVWPEAVSLARHFHGVYLALRLGRTRRRALHRALQALESAGARLLGSILLEPPVAG
jgi:Mrp family chromosome partitioning ATPase